MSTLEPRSSQFCITHAVPGGFHELAVNLMSQETVCGSSVQLPTFHSWEVVDVMGYKVEATDGRESVVKLAIEAALDNYMQKRQKRS